MEKKCLNNRNSGFSMVEMLAVVGILVILLGISMVSVARYRDLLKITELDNAAREIYMAAENRAVLLSGARRLSNQVDKSSGKPTTLTEHDWHSDAEELYYVSKANMTEDLLKTGSIDPALQKDGVDFYIVYDKNSGSVTDVFYAESSMDGLMTAGFDAFYSDWAKSRSDRLKLKDKMLVGWYNGRAAEGGTFEPDPPKDEPIIKVIIKNEEELTVTVEYEAPAPATLSVKLGSIALTNKRLVGVTLPEGEITVPAGKGSFTWVLDSLTNGKFVEIDGVKNISGGYGEIITYMIDPGDDFTVEATLTPQTPGDFENVSASDKNNSLFQEGSGETTAYIKYLRHLQNLSTYDYISGVTDKKTAAVQTADIYCHGSEAFELYQDYYFIPIFNGNITEYNGRNHEIRNLYVNYKDAAGLFSKTSEKMTLQNIRMVNATVKAEGQTVGALAGEAHGATIQNCWVYWETDETATDLKAVLGSDTDGYKFGEVGIFGSTAGGLAGEIGSGTKITNCLSATLIKGAAYAGGLVGKASGSEVVHSYADCYLTGDAQVAGLIGEAVSETQVKLTDCYAAGYIMGGKNAAGLCLGSGTTNATNVYSVMRYPNLEITDKFTFLTEKQTSDDFKNTYFLYSETKEIEVAAGKTISGRSFDDMSASDFVTRMGASSFQSKGLTDSYPYELRTPLDVYDYPGLTGMPHYGDWGKELARLSLVYYENDGGTNRVSGIGVRDLNDNTKNVTEDGYALLLRKEDGDEDKTVTVTFSYLDKNGVKQTVPGEEYTLTDAQPIEVDGNRNNSYYVLPLPANLVNSDYAEERFFRYIHFELSKENDSEGATYKGDAFFNPHFAETVQTARLKDEGTEGDWSQDKVTAYANDLVKVMGEIKVRTPRHLYDLSRFKEYYTRNSVYHQMLDLDYATYTKYGIQGSPYAQQPIGKWDEAFAGTYNGDYHVIKNVAPEVSETSKRRYAGLFGYSSGTLRNIVYEMDPEHQVTAYLGNAAQSLYVGALAGGSSGVIDNCAVYGANLRAGASGVVLYVGGLVGQNSGTIRNCAAESARLSANCFQYARIYIGGLVGENAAARSISTSYAVGRIDAEIDTTVTTARICGFVGWNYGSISNCYAAVDLRSSGDNVEAYGFCGMRAGSQSGNAYLDHGNFTYRDTSYAAKYERAGDKATSVTYARLSGKDTENPFSVSGMSSAQKSPQRVDEAELLYPYPTAVTNKEGEYVHYGRWPTPMPLGEMGVFYWEKMVDAEDGGNPTYHMSALAVDPNPGKKSITKRTTLSEAHNDGRVVTEYGYGYYAQNENDASVSLTSQKIAYIKYQEYTGKRETWLNPNHNDFTQYGNNADNNGAIKVDKWPQNTEANEALAALMSDYTFHCWDTYREAPKKADNNEDTYRAARAVPGLCRFKENADAVLDPNSGTFTLTQSGSQTVMVKFIVNPQFADAMSVAENPGNLTVSNGASTVSPGTKDSKTEEINPFQVRCGLQLQDINWYDTAYIDVPVGLGSYSAKRFPYLNKDYYWKQTHDIDWVVERQSYDLPNAENDDGVFIPIAQGFARDGEMSLSGWFAGTYDGGSYTLKNFSIGLNAKTYQINTMGLFGYVKNATLTNIVMFSESGDDVVTVRGRSKDENTGDSSVVLQNDAYAWYAGGVLVGVARNSEISNCSVAGYTIRDKTIYARSVQEGSGSSKYYTMGGAIGGLVGMTDRALENCTAAATIEIVCNHQNDTNGKSAPIRVGGLVGSTTANVTNCYTGGKIVTSIQDENGKIVEQAQNSAIYAGRLVGGVGMGPFNNSNGTNSETGATTVTVSGCYSYLTLPDTGGVVQACYNIGGGGRADRAPAGTVTTTRDYYYGANVGDGGTSVTYAQLAGDDPIDGETIYQKLNNKPGQTGEASYSPYYPVTSKIGELNVSGRFSYVPKNRKDLQGMDYPFPTILTQTRVSDGMVFRVHYGGWEPKGIIRLEGNQPIELDMFTKQTYTETLALSKGITGGTWGPVDETIFGDGVVKAKVTKDGELIVKALKANDTPVTVTVKYTIKEIVNGEERIKAEYSLSITVYVTAKVELRPSAVSIFPNDEITVSLTPYGRWPGSNEYMSLTEGKLKIEAGGVKSLDASLTANLAGSEDAPAITLTSKGLAESTKVNVTYDYACTYPEGSDPPSYTVTGKTDQISVTLLDLPEGKWSEDGTTWEMDFQAYAVEKLKAELADAALTGFTVDPDGTGTETAIKLTKEENAEFPEKGVELKVTLTLEGLEHTLTVTVPKPAESEKVP